MNIFIPRERGALVQGMREGERDRCENKIESVTEHKRGEKIIEGGEKRESENRRLDRREMVTWDT